MLGMYICGFCSGVFLSSVEVSSITPAYYAINASVSEFVFTGSGFLTLPQSCVVPIARSNDTPLENQYSTNHRYFMVLSVESDTLARATYPDGISQQFSYALYAGAIVSPDRDIVFWQNETRPLPAS